MSAVASSAATAAASALEEAVALDAQLVSLSRSVRTPGDAELSAHPLLEQARAVLVQQCLDEGSRVVHGSSYRSDRPKGSARHS